jgi:RNA polymerase sigma-B factor
MRPSGPQLLTRPATPDRPDEIATADPRFARYRATGDRAIRNALVEDHQWLARHCVRRFKNTGEPTDDLTQVALFGLVKAVDRFDPAFGFAFSTFAMPTILGELRRHFRDRVWTLRVPRGLQERIRDVESAIAKLSHELERSPTVAEIASLLDITEADVLESFEATVARRTVSLDQPSPAGDQSEQAPMAERIGRDDPGFELVEDREAIEASAGILDDTEREILRLRFEEDLTQSKIAEQVGYSQMHVSRILRRALGKLREASVDPDEN